MEDRSENIEFTANKSWVENTAYGGHICKLVKLYSVDSRIICIPSSSQRQHRIRHTSTGTVPAHVEVGHEQSEKSFP